MSAPRLIATDLDHTLLDDAGHVSPRTRAALDAARAAGVAVVPVTARQPVGLRALADESGFDSWALCGNGSLCLHLSTGEILFVQETPAEVLQSLAASLNERIPGLHYASVRGDGEGFAAERGYAALADFSDHKRDPSTMSVMALEEVLSEPSLKLVVRHPELSPSALLDAVRQLGLTGFEATLSGAPFLEVMAEGVTKGAALARLCGELGIDRTEVVAFGDGLNDIAMLEWAGRGVAVANAQEAVRDVADEVAAANHEDGVARVIERLLAEGDTLRT